ncbi:uncharacterized protein CDAR_299901 [Caerostris darwini]|uniref:Uncharacterized protein n=1 Tax=Caerostris darwini TaxID=1538125 RepID=A0AAV4W5F5_9ARAC|nr:uncharacterized protein CDAR_299901 [Caerostris darwini]
MRLFFSYIQKYHYANLEGEHIEHRGFFVRPRSSEGLPLAGSRTRAPRANLALEGGVHTLHWIVFRETLSSKTLQQTSARLEFRQRATKACPDCPKDLYWSTDLLEKSCKFIFQTVLVLLPTPGECISVTFQPISRGESMLEDPSDPSTARRKSMDPVSQIIHLEELPTPGGRFELQELLGVGSCARVLAATDKQKGENFIFFSSYY